MARKALKIQRIQCKIFCNYFNHHSQVFKKFLVFCRLESFEPCTQYLMEVYEFIVDHLPLPLDLNLQSQSLLQVKLSTQFQLVIPQVLRVKVFPQKELTQQLWTSNNLVFFAFFLADDMDVSANRPERQRDPSSVSELKRAKDLCTRLEYMWTSRVNLILENDLNDHRCKQESRYKRGLKGFATDWMLYGRMYTSRLLTNNYFSSPFFTVSPRTKPSILPLNDSYHSQSQLKSKFLQILFQTALKVHCHQVLTVFPQITHFSVFSLEFTPILSSKKSWGCKDCERGRGQSQIDSLEDLNDKLITYRNSKAQQDMEEVVDVLIALMHVSKLRALNKLSERTFIKLHILAKGEHTFTQRALLKLFAFPEILYQKSWLVGQDIAPFRIFQHLLAKLRQSSLSCQLIQERYVAGLVGHGGSLPGRDSNFPNFLYFHQQFEWEQRKNRSPFCRS